MSDRRLGVVAALAALSIVPLAGTRSTFVPDWTFKGSTLTGWHVLGDAEWKAADGELIGTPKSADGGWLVLDRSFQDVEFGADFKCVSGCRTGVLLRAEKTPTGMKGVFLSLDAGEVGGYAVTLDANGGILTRERLRPGGGLMRVAPSAAEAAAAAAARGGGAGRGGRGGPGAAVAPGGRGRGVLPSGATLPNITEPSDLKPNDWNDLDVVIDANILRPWVNTAGTGGGAADDDLGKFGPIAIYVGGSGQVHFRDVSYRDLSLKRVIKEELSPNYQMLRLTPFYYSFASGAADFDRDGNLDVVSGPFIFMGPDFTKAREFYMALTTNPSTSFSSNWLEFAGDYTGDGWPDVLLASTSGTRLYVNPKGEPRRWDSYAAIVPPAPNVSEVSVMKDIDADGKPDLVYASAGAVRWAKPDPANPTGPWLSTQVGEPGTYAAHGIGAGDINGDGRVDILNVYGWWEQPAKATTEMWPYHPEPFGRQNGRGAPGGAEMCVYDVNGDKLNDVVTSLQAHVFGLAWFEQKRDAGGKISFVRHMISDSFATKNAGGVVFSQPHGSACADMNGDGTSDFVIGKRFFSHNESYADPDPYGAAVLYIYRTVRSKQAPGGAEFVPELVHNQSGAGSQVLAVDLNKDGVMDLVTSGELGAYAFLGKPRAKR
jgi:3-keto-disaccharide hydrolase/FG-GAP-like repeat